MCRAWASFGVSELRRTSQAGEDFRYSLRRKVFISSLPRTGIALRTATKESWNRSMLPSLALLFQGVFEFIVKVLYSWPQGAQSAWMCTLSMPQHLDIKETWIHAIASLIRPPYSEF